MKVAIFPGCIAATEQYACELSTREVLRELGVEVVEVPGFSCCGWPLQNVGTVGWVYLAARNMALAAERGVPLITLCNVCNRMFYEAKFLLTTNSELREKISSLLKEEGRGPLDGVEILHPLELFHDRIGVEEIKKRIKKPLKGLKLAAHTGCQAIRPRKLRSIDDPEYPKKLPSLIEALGAQSPHYPEALDCCGAYLFYTRKDASLTLAGEKVEAVQNWGFDGLVTVCSSGHRMLDGRQDAAATTIGKALNLPVVYYTQLLGLAMGLAPEKLGLQLNRSPVKNLLEKIG
ncbi:MAG: CoB--CoM heterodisulfide reductase iron-sulfur subunit B family protein [Candidatus Hadarchaeales archaeon]